MNISENSPIYAYPSNLAPSVDPPLSIAKTIGGITKLVAIGLMLFSTSSIADYRNRVSYVSGFINSVDVDLTQAYDTKLKYSCGPTSLLYVANYHYRRAGITPWFTQDIMSTHYQIRNMYKDMNVPLNSSRGVSTGQLRSLAKYNWGWRTAAVAGTSSGTSANFNNMVKRLRKNQPVIVALKAKYSPVRGYDHLVVVYKYDHRYDRVYYFDPYYGGIHTFTKNTFGNAVQGNGGSYFVAVPYQ